MLGQGWREVAGRGGVHGWERDKGMEGPGNGELEKC